MNPEQYYDELLRTNQLDLSQIERARLEQITHGLLQGQIHILDMLCQETQQSSIIKRQQEMITGLNSAISSANQLVTHDQHHDLVVGLLTYIPSIWDDAKQDLFLPLWRMAEMCIQNGDLDDSTTQWWQTMASSQFTKALDQQPNSPEDLDEQVLEDASV